MTEFTREIKFEPGFDYRKDPEKKQYGRHGMNIVFHLYGPEASIICRIFTGWLPTLFNESGLYISLANALEPIQAGIWIHSDDLSDQKCEYRRQGYCKCTSFTSQKHLKLLVTEGDEAVWKSLEDKYHDIYGNT